MNSTKARPASRVRRGSNILAAFLIGLPLAAGVLAAAESLLPGGTLLQRYTSHPVEKAEIVLFCCALAALAHKAWHHLWERRACQREMLPAFDGQPVSAAEAVPLLAQVRQLPRSLLQSRLGQRILAALDFVVQRESASDLDDQLRSLSDEDALSLDSSYSLIRFITWAIPILGFLGTVLGITGAISGVTPEVLEQSLSTVTNGLALAFDTTAVALCLTMATMFGSFLVERMEQSLLENVDAHVERELAHRFSRLGMEIEPIRALVEKNSEVLLHTVELLVHRQADIWGESLGRIESHQMALVQEQQHQVAAALNEALQTTLQAHAQHLADYEQQTVEKATLLYDQLSRMSTGMQSQVELLHQLQEDENRLIRMQAVLQQNLDTLAGAGAFEQAVHSLTAAIHLMTARPPLGLTRPEGKAA